MTLLQVEDLHTHFITRDLVNRIRVAKALNAVSFTLEEGEIFGLVGETGAGKSLTAHSVMGLLRPPARIVHGSIMFAGRNLLELSIVAIRVGHFAARRPSYNSILGTPKRIVHERVHARFGRGSERHFIPVLMILGISVCLA